MTYRWKIIFSGIIISLISISVYMSLRMDTFEKQYASQLKNKNSSILRYYKKFSQDNKAIGSDSLSVFIQQVNTSVPALGLVLLADNKKNIKIASKNERYIPTVQLYDKIIEDFSNNTFDKISHGNFIIKYYDTKIDGTLEQLKFYIFNNFMGSHVLLTVFPYNPGKVIITKASLEISLIIVIVLILCTFAYIIHQKKGIITDISKKPTARSSMHLGKRKLSDDDKLPARGQASTASDSLSTYILKLFKEIHKNYNTQSVALFIKEDPDTMTKLFELKGSSFIKTESSNFDVIDLNNEVGQEIRKGFPLFLHEGRKAILPLVYNGSLMGIIHIMTNRSLDAGAIDSIERSSRRVLKHVSDYLVLSNVMIHRTTGLYSEAYFKMKFNETASMAERNGQFSLILISIARTTKHLLPSQKEEVIKMIAPVLEDAVSLDHALCHFENFLALIMPGTGYSKARKITDKVFKTLQRVRIKISPDDYLDVEPFIGLASSDYCDSPHDVLENARKNIDLALTRDDANIQDSKMML